MLEQSLKLELQQEPLQDAARLLMLDVHNIEYYHEIMELFIARGRTAQLEEFLARLEKALHDDPRVMGHLYVIRAGVATRVSGNNAAKKDYLKKARQKYREVYGDDDEVIRKIDRELR